MNDSMRTLAAALLALTAACGGGGYTTTASNGNPSGGSTSSSITVGNNVFDPKSTTVPVGTSVTWTWAAGDVTHNVTFDDGAKSGDQSTGTYGRMFAAAGTYPYHCTIHGTVMSGTVIVQ